MRPIGTRFGLPLEPCPTSCRVNHPLQFGGKAVTPARFDALTQSLGRTATRHHKTVGRQEALRRVVGLAVAAVAVRTSARAVVAAPAAQVDCPAGLVECDGTCTTLITDPFNCGGCGVVCGAGQVCEIGFCGQACLPGLLDCGAGCVNLLADPSNCGACSNACPPFARCRFGTCDVVPPPTFTCPPPQVECQPQQCVLLDFDEANCGGCGVVCPAHMPVCRDGHCEQLIVQPPFLS
jgi:hypothetical protein